MLAAVPPVTVSTLVKLIVPATAPMVTESAPAWPITFSTLVIVTTDAACVPFKVIVSVPAPPFTVLAWLPATVIESLMHYLQ